MLYPTHRRYGQAYTFLGIPVLIMLGYFPTVRTDLGLGMILGDLLVVFLYVLVAYRGSLFGAEFPDIDSPGSIPAKKHFFLRNVFKFFRVKHRGKFSHDFTSLGILFGLLYGFVDHVLGGLMTWLLSRGVGNSDLTPLVALLSTDGLLLSLIKTYILFVWIGAYSHLIADASTKQGVWLFWKIKIHIVPVFIIKWKIGGWQPFKNAFKTGSDGWEPFNRRLMTFVLVIAIIVSLLFIFV